MTTYATATEIPSVSLPTVWTVGIVRVGRLEYYDRWFQETDHIENEHGTRRFETYEIDEYTELAVVKKSTMDVLNIARNTYDETLLTKAAREVVLEAQENRWDIL